MATYSSSPRLVRGYDGKFRDKHYYGGFGPVNIIPLRFRVRFYPPQLHKSIHLHQISMDLNVVKCRVDPAVPKYWHKPRWVRLRD